MGLGVLMRGGGECGVGGLKDPPIWGGDGGLGAGCLHWGGGLRDPQIWGGSWGSWGWVCL